MLTLDIRPFSEAALVVTHVAPESARLPLLETANALVVEGAEESALVSSPHTIVGEVVQQLLERGLVRGGVRALWRVVDGPCPCLSDPFPPYLDDLCL